MTKMTKAYAHRLLRGITTCALAALPTSVIPQEFGSIEGAAAVTRSSDLQGECTPDDCHVTISIRGLGAGMLYAILARHGTKESCESYVASERDEIMCFIEDDGPVCFVGYDPISNELRSRISC
jgi:hypothetical protein